MHVTVSDLSVAYRDADGWLEAVRDVSLEVTKGEVLGLVGELGSGCPFRSRCDYAEPACATEAQRFEPVTDRHLVACRRWRHIAPSEVGPAFAVVARDRAAGRPPVLEVDNVTLGYGGSRTGIARYLYRALPPVVHDVSLQIAEGETFALVGESGSGKSAIA